VVTAASIEGSQGSFLYSFEYTPHPAAQMATVYPELPGIGTRNSKFSVRFFGLFREWSRYPRMPGGLGSS